MFLHGHNTLKKRGFKMEKIEQELADEILEIVTMFDGRKANILDVQQGLSVSHLRELLQDKGWKLPRGCEFESLVSKLGFTVTNLIKKNGEPVNYRYGVCI